MQLRHVPGSRPAAVLFTALAAICWSPGSTAQERCIARHRAALAAVERGEEAFAAGRYGLARRAFAEARAANSPRAHFLLGLMHRHGLGGPVRLDRAEICLRSAAEHRILPAMAEWVDLLDRRSAETSLSTSGQSAFEAALERYRESELGAAFDAFKPLATDGHVGACFLLGEMYEWRLSRELNQGRAAYWYAQAALADDDEAMRRLAWMLLEGEFVEADPDSARDLFRRAVLLGNERAVPDLADLYRRILPKDPGALEQGDRAEACVWFRLALEQGDSSFLEDFDRVVRRLDHMEQERFEDRLREVRPLLKSGLLDPDLDPIPYLDAVRRSGAPARESSRVVCRAT